MNEQKSEKSNNDAQTLESRVKPREAVSNEETTASLGTVLSSEEAAAKLERKYNEVQKKGQGMKTRRKEQKQNSGRDHTENRPLKMLFFSVTTQKLRMYKKETDWRGATIWSYLFMLPFHLHSGGLGNLQGADQEAEAAICRGRKSGL